MMQVVVTLVHGTFARNARWTGAGSAMRTWLSAVNENVLFNEFSWSGFNSVHARTKAAAALASSLEMWSKTMPGARHVVIGHSHGGAVGLIACGAESVRDNVAAVVCLSTPFICVQLRSPSKLDEFGTWILMCLCGALASFAAFQVPKGWYVPVAFFGTLFGMSGILTFLGRWFDQKARRTLGELVDFQPVIPSSKVLLMRALGDEASMALSTSQFLAWIGLRTSRLMSRSWDLYDHLVENSRLGRWITYVSCYLLFGGVLVLLLGGALSQIEPQFGDNMLTFGMIAVAGAALVFLVTAGGCFLVLILCAFVIIGLIPIAGLLLTPFGGGDVGFASMLADVSVEATPSGRWEVLVIGEHSAEPSKELLRHSQLYSDERALAIICNFVRESLVPD